MLVHRLRRWANIEPMSRAQLLNVSCLLGILPRELDDANGSDDLVACHREILGGCGGLVPRIDRSMK